MHGTVWPTADQWDNFVITEEDYIEFLSRMTTKSVLRYRRILYATRVIAASSSWATACATGTSASSCAICDVPPPKGSTLIRRRAVVGDPARSVGPLEQRLWARRNVDIFDMDLDTFVVMAP